MFEEALNFLCSGVYPDPSIQQYGGTRKTNLARQWILLLKPPVSTLKPVLFHIFDVMKVANK
jgi:hypothetical protein